MHHRRCLPRFVERPTGGASKIPKIVSASEAKNKLGSIIGWVLRNNDEVIVESRGVPTVVIMSMAEYESVKALKEQARRGEALEALRRLRERVMVRNQDLTPEEGDALADRFSREIVEDLVEEGKVRFER